MESLKELQDLVRCGFYEASLNQRIDGTFAVSPHCMCACTKYNPPYKRELRAWKQCECTKDKTLVSTHDLYSIKFSKGKFKVTGRSTGEWARENDLRIKLRG